jgi:curved DNA-binding protein
VQFADHYKTLGVAPDATAAVIKAAYRRLARTSHPDVDRRPGAEKRFSAIGAANDTLSDPAKRAEFDLLRGGGWRDGQEMDPPRQRQAEPRHESTGPFDADVLDQLFGSRGRRSSFRSSGFPERGRDLRVPFPVSLEESFLGSTREFQIQGQTPSGKPPTITVTIPSGVVQDTAIRLRGQGGTGIEGAPDGDLYLIVDLIPHRLYQVDGHDLALKLPIAPWEAALGAQVDVPTLGGMVHATIPPGARHGQRLRLKARGLPGSPPGDQYLDLHIAMPDTCSDTARDLYRQLAKDCSFDPRKNLGA